MEKFIKRMEKAEEDARHEVRDTVAAVAALCEKHRALGKKFTFDAAGEDADVNALLLAMSDRLMSDFEDAARLAISDAEAEDDESEIMPYLARERDGLTVQDRIDRQAARLKYRLEGLLAVAFAENVRRGEIKSWLSARVSSPSMDGRIADARTDPDYAASWLKEGDLNSRPGYANDIAKAVAVIGSTMAAEAYNYGKILGYRRSGAVGYGVRRNSSYDCPLCDEICAVAHPFSEIVVPAHPHCCCSTFPVFRGDL